MAHILDAIPFVVGSSVKYTEYALRSKRDAWLDAGSYQAKDRAAQWLREAQAVRGVVTAILDNGIVVTTDDGLTHESLCYIWELAA
jgi:ribosomal protein S1